MNRRSFIRNMGMALVAASVPLSAAGRGFELMEESEGMIPESQSTGGVIHWIEYGDGAKGWVTEQEIMSMNDFMREQEYIAFFGQRKNMHPRKKGLLGMPLF